MQNIGLGCAGFALQHQGGKDKVKQVKKWIVEKSDKKYFAIIQQSVSAEYNKWLEILRGT